MTWPLCGQGDCEATSKGAERREAIAAVGSCVSRWTDDEGKAIQLGDLEGRSVADITREPNRAEGAVNISWGRELDRLPEFDCNNQSLPIPKCRISPHRVETLVAVVGSRALNPEVELIPTYEIQPGRLAIIAAVSLDPGGADICQRPLAAPVRNTSHNVKHAPDSGQPCMLLRKPQTPAQHAHHPQSHYALTVTIIRRILAQTLERPRNRARAKSRPDGLWEAPPDR